VKKNQISRRTSALQRLETQIENGTRIVKDSVVPLTEKNIKRINKEIEILKNKIN
jgi:hypothetical protein|tara:strand:+ start:886 stop:1050 length:165 start_codon:yes stop_codon:yes gene_type:complete